MNASEQATLPGFEPTVLERIEAMALETEKASERYERKYGREQPLQDDEDAVAGRLDE
jgi:hypothetical protein